MDSLGYAFKNSQWLEEALTHPSCNLKTEDGSPFSYQRLEFLGDAVLGAVVSQLLFEHFPQESEGALARRKAALVNKEAVAEVVRELGIQQHIRFSATEEQSGAQENISVQEDVGEAVIGAIFTDGGYEAARAFIEAHWLPRLHAQTEAPVDAKTALQEWTQARGLGLPAYSVVGQEGPAHAPLFTVEVAVEGQPSQQAAASNKRQAEQLAADQMLQQVITHD